MSSKKSVWRLNAKQERRVKSGHPWVFSNELRDSPAGITPGQQIELQDAAGNFVSHGVGNPASLIAFRVWSRDKATEIFSLQHLMQLFKSALLARSHFFAGSTSFRWVFGESDGAPGLVVDRYVVTNGDGDSPLPLTVVIVVESHSAGVDVHFDPILEALFRVHQDSPFAAVECPILFVLKQDAGSRQREGLSEIPPRVLTVRADVDEHPAFGPVIDDKGVDLSKATVSVGNTFLTCDLLKGQKTGLFLDQTFNVQTVAAWIQNKNDAASGPVKILDLCCYVGHWGVGLAQALLLRNTAIAELTFVDASRDALVFAEMNAARLFPNPAATPVKARKCDVLDADAMAQFLNGTYDVVIADPPALIKARSKIESGKQGYVKLMGMAMQALKPGGILVAGSCSQLLSETDFSEVLSKASRKSGVKMQWVRRMGLSPDHPRSTQFPESDYLKTWVGFRQ